MSDEYGLRYREDNGAGWFVGIIVALATLAIAYLVFTADLSPRLTTDEQVKCMIANGGADCQQVARWEPVPVAPSIRSETLGEKL